jgi:septum site-determining protein MinD
MKAIAIASGKGGTGKSTIALNLGIALAKAGKRVIVIDADVAMASLGVMLGIERTPISLHNILMGEGSVREAIYDGPAGMKYIPSSLSLDRFKRVDSDKLKGAVRELEGSYDYVLIDCPPGLGSDAEIAIKAANDLLLVLTPDAGALADAIKVKNAAAKAGLNLMGFVINMSLRERGEIKRGDLETILGMPFFVEIPYDQEVRRAVILQTPVIIRSPASAFSAGISSLVSKIAGEKVVLEKPKRGFLAGLLSAIGLGRKR